MSLTPNQPPPAPPLVLFDGVCNLCNGAVQWLLARDRRGRLRFASLQSQAAAQALGAAGVSAELPDSIVLIDGGRVHVRSDAALRLTRHLGFPWPMLGVFRLIPRPLRDGVYAWIARHRYAWFGQRETCALPTTALRQRFLDAEELVANTPRGPGAAATDVAAATSPQQAPVRIAQSQIANAEHVTDVNNGRGGAIERNPGSAMNQKIGAKRKRRDLGQHARQSPWILGWLGRLVLAYFLLYNLNNLVSPFNGWLVRPLVLAFARLALGIEISVFPGGSGDTTYNYVEVLILGLLALLAALLWNVTARGAAPRALTLDRIAAFLRYTLAATLLSYGWHKLVPLQMPFPGPDRLLTSYHDSSPMGLLWTFIGASPAYQMFTGLAEVLAGLLLFWRRTALLGALASSAVFLNVAALNYCYDVPVKLYSTHLLLQSLLLVAPELPRLAGLFFLHLPVAPRELDPFPYRRPWVRRVHRGLQVLLFVLLAILPPFQGLAQLAEYQAAAQKPWHGLWRVENFELSALATDASAALDAPNDTESSGSTTAPAVPAPTSAVPGASDPIPNASGSPEQSPEPNPERSPEPSLAPISEPSSQLSSETTPASSSSLQSTPDAPSRPAASPDTSPDTNPAQRWLRVGLNGLGSGAIQRADGQTRRQRMEVDPELGHLTITRSDLPAPLVLDYQQPSPDLILLSGPFEGAHIRLELHRETATQPLLTTRGFHWINEFPLNR